MTTTSIDTSVSFEDLQLNAEKVITKVGKTAMNITKTVGLWRAALTIQNPEYEQDQAKALSLSYNLLVKYLTKSGMPKAQARSLVNNAKSPSVLAGAVILGGLSEKVYNAVPVRNCQEVADHIATLSPDDLSEINEMKLGNKLTKKAKQALGIKPPAPKVVAKETTEEKAPKVEDEVTEDLSDDKAIMKCLSLLTEVKQVADKHLCQSSKLEVRQAVLDLLHDFNRAKGDGVTPAA